MDDANRPHTDDAPAGRPAAVAGLVPLREQFGPVSDAIIRAAHEAVVMVDDAQHIVMTNPAAQRMFGYVGAELHGSHLSRLIPPQHRKAHMDHVRSFARAGAVERAMGERSAVSGLRANGQEFPAAITICQVDVPGDSGPRRYFAALVMDLSESTGMRNEIDNMGRRMRAIFDLSPVAIWITDVDRITFANRACTSLFGAATAKELIGRSVYDLLRPESHASMRDAVARALGGDHPIPVVRESILQTDGGVRSVEMVVAALPDHGTTALQMVIMDITLKSDENRALELSRRQLRELSAGMVTAREEERRRIARELHDELGQQLTILKMEIAGVSAESSGDRIEECKAAMLEMVDDTIHSVRRLATDLRPLMLDDLGLNAAIDWLADGWARRTGIAVRLQLDNDEPQIGQPAAIALYRMVQEALTNVARHARATKVRVRLQHDGDQLVLEVRDNGVGFDERSMYNTGSHGLMGIRERAYMLGGSLEIGNATSGGGRVVVRLPLQLPDHNDADGADTAPRATAGQHP
jgi:two-component system sensor histidine kinase UhpB